MKHFTNNGPFIPIPSIRIPLCTLLLFIQVGCQNEGGQRPMDHQQISYVESSKEKWHWDRSEKQSEAGYAQVVKSGNMVFISGVPSSDLSHEGIAQLYKTLNNCLQSFGANPHHVVKETLYTSDIEVMKSYNSVRKAFYEDDYPAATWVEVQRFYEPGAKLEIELIAMLPNSSEQ